uniref:Uncharacterized protein n=1 Tax=Lepeophtheirus salmonis TaxID=72036 RepID=A0A0K2U2R2_LEPSM
MKRKTEESSTDELIQGLSSIQLKDEEDNLEEKIVSLELKDSELESEKFEYVAKGPVFRSDTEVKKYNPYDRRQGTTNNPGIPVLPERKESQINMNLMKSMIGYEDDGLHVFFEISNQTNVFNNNYFVIIPYSFDIDLEKKIIGFDIPKLQIPNHIQVKDDKIKLFIKVYPSSIRFIEVIAEVEKDMLKGKEFNFIKSQFITFNSIKSKSGIMRIASGLSESDITSALKIVESKVDVELFKTYGPNNDTLLSMLCFSKDESPSNKAKVLALTRKILSHADLKYRSNLIFKNESDINALEFAATTNKPDIAAYIAELYYYVGEDVLCRDAEGNTLLHLLARKGDVVSPSLKALLDLTLSNGQKMFLASVCNKIGQSPLHIAARGSNTTNTVRILYEAYPDALTTKSINGSLPLHMVCQYSSDPTLIKIILDLNPSVVNEVCAEGYTPLHLLASRGNKSVPNVTPMEEIYQLEAVKELISKGADCKKTVANRFPCDLVDDDRVRVKLLLKVSYSYDVLRSIDNNNSNCNDNSMNNNNLINPNDLYFNGNRQPVNRSNSGGNFNYGRSSSNNGYEDLKLATGNSPTPSTYSSGFESCPSSVHSPQSKCSSTESTPIHQNVSISPRNTEPIYQFSPTNSCFNDYKGSDEENEGDDLDAIAGVLYQHPSIQAAVTMAENLQ